MISSLCSTWALEGKLITSILEDFEHNHNIQ